MSDAALVIDVGGTRTRFALARRQGGGIALEATQVVATPDGTLHAAIRDYLTQQAVRPAAIGAAVAGPVDGRGDAARARLTNHPLAVSAGELAESAGGVPALLCNDLGAAAAALAVLEPQQLSAIGAVPAVGGNARALIGVGTGIGVAALLADGSIAAGEGGHIEAPFRDELAARLREQGARSIEDMLAGSQLAKLYFAAGGKRSEARSDGIMQLAGAGDAAAQTALRWHTQALGSFARDCALMFGAWSGVYLMGGAVDGQADSFDDAAFRAAFASHRTFGARLAQVPTFRIRHPYPGLLGLAAQLLPG